MVSDHFIFMVQVMINAIRVRRIYIEPRVVGSSLVACRIPVQFCIRMRSCKVVIYNVNYNCHSAAVALVNEFLIHLTRAISLVKGKI